MNAGQNSARSAMRRVLSGKGPAIACCAAMLFATGAVAQRLPASTSSQTVPNGAGELIFCNGLEPTLGCAAGVFGQQQLITLEQLSPLTGQAGGSVPIQFRAGWPLIFRASVRGQDMLGIGRLYGRHGFERQNLTFPEVAQGGAIVFDNPDGAWSFAVPTNAPHDELLAEFYPDPGDVSRTLDDVIDVPHSHDNTLRYALRPEFGGPLPKARPDGSFPQTSVADGVQFGTDDDFPGLVIVSNVGVGVVMTPLASGWTAVSPRQARNLAGFVNSVGYELSDTLGRTSITSTLIVPRFLFSRIRVRDLCVGTVQFDGNNNPIGCSGPALQRVEGGPSAAIAATSSIDQSVVEIRAFVVASVFNAQTNRLEGLDTVTDMNADGVVGAVDAQLMGRRVLSNEVVFNFRQIGSDTSAGQLNNYATMTFCNGSGRPDEGTTAAGADLEYDIDGNGYDVLEFAGICPGGSSGVTQPPR